ncbi:FecR family protein [Sphingomonas sp. RIT328]|uniref:FecR family protein n=1 Tax=Sphingomonas sp. RIT328 TaxID=1470591 RepID=UPI0004526A14|nr:FecR domain-containing protein [Sphingomonas sp. RIT328]EZP49999.1 FecR family protein [Sphingomonas sp. RIT328]
MSPTGWTPCVVTDPRFDSAAAWAGRLDSADDATRQAFAEWRSDPANEAAWRAVDDARRSAVALADHPDLLGLRHATIARAVRNRPYQRTYRRWAFAAAACAVIAAPLAWLTVPSDGRPGVSAPNPTYRTDVGQRLAVTLPDGSRLTLNTDSRVRLAYDTVARRLLLDRGQALFEVAKHQGRPFVVVAGGQEVTAHGTEFDVRLESDATQVALIEGKVSVASTARTGRPATAMTVDDVLVASPTGVSIRHTPGGAAALASWSEGRLTFADQTLASAVAEMNRYGSQPIRITDPRAAALRISGSFRTGEVAPFIGALTAGFPVTIHERATGEIEIGYRR